MRCVPEPHTESGDVYYLETTINLRQPGRGVINLLSMFLGSDTSAVVCEPPGSDGVSRCAALPTDASPRKTAYFESFDLPIESAAYVTSG